MASMNFDIADLLKLIDPSKLDSNPELKAKIETEQKKAESAAKFSGIKTKYESAILPLIEKLNALSINTNVDIIQVVLTKDIEHSVFTESLANQTQVKFAIPADLKLPNVCDLFLELMEYDEGAAVVERLFEPSYGSKVVKSLSDLSAGNENKRKIQKLIKDNPIPFDKVDLEGLEGLKYVISGSRKDGVFTFTAKVDMSTKIEGAKTPSQPKLDANGQPIESKKESAPKGFHSWSAYFKSVAADSYLGNIYAGMSEKEKEDSRIAYYMKQAIAKEKGIAKELASQEVRLTEYI